MTHGFIVLKQINKNPTQQYRQIQSLVSVPIRYIEGKKIVSSRLDVRVWKRITFFSVKETLTTRQQGIAQRSITVVYEI